MPPRTPEVGVTDAAFAVAGGLEGVVAVIEVVVVIVGVLGVADVEVAVVELDGDGEGIERVEVDFEEHEP